MTHWDATMQILRYFKKSPGKGLLYSNCEYTRVGFQMLIGEDHLLIGDLPHAFACSLEEILCHEKTSRVWCHDLVWCQYSCDGECNL